MEPMDYTYKNTSDTEQMLIGVGMVQPGEIVTTDHEVNNDNFQRTSKSEKRRVDVQKEAKNTVTPEE